MEERTMPIIHPVVDEGLGNSAYVVELGDGRALVIDPARDPTPYLALARWRRLQIAYAAETHLHADFLTGSRELAATAGAEILAPRTSRLGFAYRGLEDGEEVDLGGLTLLALLRCLGAARGQGFRTVLGEAAVLGLLSSLLGLGAGFGVALGLRQLLASLGADDAP